MSDATPQNLYARLRQSSGRLREIGTAITPETIASTAALVAPLHARIADTRRMLA